MATVWRLLVDGRAPGPWNMGVDEALFSTAVGGRPALRLYRWQGPWLSLGYAQAADQALRARCARAGVGVLRRSTGGAAVLHGRDLTYALAAPVTLLPGGLRASYALVSAALAQALAELGVAVERPQRPSRARAFDCFAAPAAQELCVDGLKLVGSAQRRARGALLQHGSIRLAPDPPGARAAAGLGPAATLRELGRCDDPVRLGQALCRALARALDAHFEPAALEAAERARAARRGSSPPAAESPIAPQGPQEPPPLADRY